jgi:hypothetical protein
VLSPLNSLDDDLLLFLQKQNLNIWYVPFLRYTRGLGWRMHCGVEVTESSTNKQQHLQTASDLTGKKDSLHALVLERECSEKSFPYLLSAQDFGDKCWAGPCWSKTAWASENSDHRDTRRRYTVSSRRSRSCSYTVIHDSSLGLLMTRSSALRSTAERATGQNPTVLESGYQGLERVRRCGAGRFRGRELCSL